MRINLDKKTQKLYGRTQRGKNQTITTIYVKQSQRSNPCLLIFCKMSFLLDSEKESTNFDAKFINEEQPV